MKQFNASTESFIESEKTKIATDISSGTDVSIAVDNSGGFSENDFLIIGNKGNDKAEVCQINASISSNTSFQVATLKFNHDEDEPIVKIRFNQRKLYGCETKDGSYSVVTTGTSSPKELEVDNPQGTYFEYTGTTYSYFKCTYYNSETSDETNLSDSVTVHAVTSATYCSVSDIRIKAGLTNNSYVSDGRISDERTKVQNYIDGKLKSVYDIPFSDVPDVIEDICIRISAGRIMNEILSGTSDKADEMIKGAKADLMEIIDGNVELVDSEGNKMTSSGTSSLKGYPDNSTDDSFDDMFKIDTTF